MVSYKINEDIYDLPEDKVENFLTKFPNAEKLEAPGKITPTAPGAVVEETAAPDTDSNLEDPLLALQKQLDAIKPNDPNYNSKETILLRRKLKNLKAERIEKLEEVVVTAPTQKNKEISKTNEVIDDVFEDSELLKKLSGSDNILTLASENMGQIPREVRREIADRLGYSRTVVLGDQIKDTNEFKALEESDVQDIIKERFQELVNSQKSDRYLKSVRDSRKYLYDNKESNLEFQNNMLQADIATLSYKDRQLANINTQLNDPSKTSRERIALEEQKQKFLEASKRKIQYINNRGEAVYKEEERSFFYDLTTGMNLSAGLVENKQEKGDTVLDISDKVQLYSGLFQKTTKDKLKAGYEDLNLAIADVDREGDELFKVKLNNESLRLFVRQAGYIPNEKGEFEVPLDVLASKGYDLINKKGIVSKILRGQKGNKFEDIELADGSMPSKDFGDFVLRHQDYKIDLAAKKEAYKQLYLLNKDPKDLDRPRSGEQFAKGIEGGFGFNPRNNKIRASDILPEINTIIAENNISLSEDQKNALDLTFTEELTETAGGFVPILAQFAVLNKGQALVASTTKLGSLMNIGAQVNRMGKARAIGLNMAVEEVKTQAVGFDTGSGIAFSGLNIMMGPLKFKTKYNQMNTLFNKIGKNGLTFPVAAEGAAVFEGVIRDLAGTDEFNSWFEEHYPDFDTVSRRVAGNVIMGNALGMTHLKSIDLKTTNQIRKMQSEALNNIVEGKNVKQNQDLYKETTLYLNRMDLVDAYSPKNAQKTYDKVTEGLRKEFKQKFDIDVNFKTIENNKEKDFVSDKDKADFSAKNEKEYEVKVNMENAEIGVLPHEVGHAGIRAAIGKNVRIKQEFLESFESILKDIKIEDGRSLLDAIKQEKSITEIKTQEEMFTYAAEYLSKPKYYTQLVAQNAFSNLKQNTLRFFETNFSNTYKPKLKTKQDLIDFLGRYAISVNKGKGFSKYIDRFNEILEIGEPTKEQRKQSTELAKEVDANVERLILKQRAGVAKTEAGKLQLENKIKEQYDKIALSALGFNVRKSADAKALGLTDIQLSEAKSFIGEYYKGIKDRYNPEVAAFSTLVYSNIRPKQQLFYEQALGKGRETTTRIDEGAMQIADVSTKVAEAPKLIEPLETLAPNKFKQYQSQYEAGLKNIDLSKQDYSTLKDAAPNVTKEIFGGKSFKEQQDFINKNLKTIYDLFPLSFRRMTEGTKSSTKIQRSILDNFYITGERAKMDVGTAAGLPIKAKMPFDAIIPEGPNKGKKVSDLFKELVGIGVEPNRNQRTFVKGLQAEIGKAITNRVVRQTLEKQNNTAELVQKLADGKSDLMQSKVLENNRLNNVIKKYNGNMELIRKNNPKAAAELDALTEKLIIAQGGIDNAVNYVKDFQKNTLYEFKNLDLSNIQRKNYKEIDVAKATEFAKNTRELLEYLPSWMNKTMGMGLLTTHYRTNMEGISPEKVKEKTNKENQNFTEVPEFAKTWDPSKTGKKGQELWEGISQADINSINVLKEAYNKAHKLYEQGKNTEADAIISNAYSKIGNNIKKKMIEAWGNSLETWYKSSTNEAQKLERAKHIMLMGRNNTNVEQGLRQLVPVEAIFTGKMKGTDITKLEHASPMAKFALEFSRSIIEGTWQSNKRNIIDNYTGIVGPKRIFDIVDAVGKKTNPAGLVRMMFDPSTLKMFKTIDSGFKKSLYDKFTESTGNVQKQGQIVRQAREFLITEFQKQDAANTKALKERYQSTDLNKSFNEFLEGSTGIKQEAVFSDAMAMARGRKAKKDFGDYFIPVGAEDFAGLMHKTLAKGKAGEKQLEFYKKNLYEPYNLAIENITREQVSLSNDFRALKKDLKGVPKTLKEYTEGGVFTKEQAVRVAIWNKLGYEIPGLSKSGRAELLKEVKNNPELNQFASEILRITKGDGYAKPENSWVAGNIALDMVSLLNKTKRSKHLEVWQNNVNTIFSKENLNKLEAAYGKNYVTTLTRTLERMKTGSNRKWGGNATIQKWNDWVNGSVGTIMFLNSRSAVLQTISNINYLNFKDNNPLAAAKAFANQPQYWKDFVEIFNSDYLQNRRGGNKINVNESELALAAEKGGVQGTISYLLNKGFILTKIADSFAIASGGSTMYRNRINTYIKEGLSEAAAKEKAFLDFKAITEETQQSSRPDRISEQQAGNLGRFMLAFANTPMQYNRIIKRNAQDLFSGRGNKAEKITKITYYSTIQNFIFNAMQKALFAVAFSDEDEKNVSKYSDIGNGMGDSLLRGSGLTGNAIVAVKNIAMEVNRQANKPNPNFQDAAWKALTVSPPMYGKVTRLRGAGYSAKYMTKDNIFEPSLQNPALSATAQLSSAAFNLPLDRALRKAQNIEAAMSDEAEWWQSAALLMGWGSWELGIPQPKKQTKKKTKPKKKKFGSTKTLKLK
tara:strand:- start:149 stop:7357 length:7209 start_codon:yes stop_codon:yes gene_type:complete